eukprot:239406-Amphidinium_carterae.1
MAEVQDVEVLEEEVEMMVMNQAIHPAARPVRLVMAMDQNIGWPTRRTRRRRSWNSSNKGRPCLN